MDVPFSANKPSQLIPTHIETHPFKLIVTSRPVLFSWNRYVGLIIETHLKFVVQKPDRIKLSSSQTQSQTNFAFQYSVIGILHGSKGAPGALISPNQGAIGLPSKEISSKICYFRLPSHRRDCNLRLHLIGR